MAVSRRTTYLGLALIVTLVVALALWSYGGSGGAAAPSGPRRAATTTRQARSADPAVETRPGHVNLEALRAGRGEPSDTGRNPFRFESRSPTPDDGGGRELPPPKPLDQGPAGFAPPVPTGPPPPPPIPLKFIGILTQGSKRVAVLTDGKSTPVGGVEGEIILGQYQILKIGNESIEMAYPDGRGRQTIRLTGQ
jgi:hypothetical protein